MTNHLENLKDGYARAKTDTERRAFLRASLRVMAQNAHDLEECCLGLVGILDARPSVERAVMDAVCEAIEQRHIAEAEEESA